MTYRDDELKKDIDEIKSDISVLKIRVISIVQHLNLDINEPQALNIDISIQESTVTELSSTVQEPLSEIIKIEEDVTQSSSESTNLVAVLQETLLQDGIPSEDSESLKKLSQESEPSKLIREGCASSSLIDFSFIKNEQARKIVASYDKKLKRYKEREEFLQFCDAAISLIEDFVKRFIKRKFRELMDEKNRQLIEGYALLENDWRERGFTLDNIYARQEEVRYKRQKFPEEDEKYYFDVDRGDYLSLALLEKSKMSFLTELCFAVMYGLEFYKQKNRLSNSKRSSQNQNSSAAFQRPILKIETNSQTVKLKHYYDKLYSAKKFRNIYEHNKDNKQKQADEIKDLNPYVRADLDKYAEIAEAVQWFIAQLYSALGNTSN